MSELTNKLYELKESCLFDVDSMINGTFVIEGKVSSEKDLYDYAMTLAKNAFGDEVDEKKVQGIVDNAMKDSDGDFEKASGIVTGSFNEDCDKEVANETIKLRPAKKGYGEIIKDIDDGIKSKQKKSEHEKTKKELMDLVNKKKMNEGKMSEIADSISEYIDAGKNTKEIVALLTKEYKISPKVAEDFIKKLG
jgi:hypothetical protein